MWNMEIKLFIGLLAYLAASTSAAMDKKIDRSVFLRGRMTNKYIEPCEDTYFNCKTKRYSIHSIKVKVDKCNTYKSKKGCKTCRGTGNIVTCPTICDCKECERHYMCSNEKTISPKTCGKSSVGKMPNIVNGTVSTIGQWPWHAGLSIKLRNTWILACGGALLNDKWVITAAHCVCYTDSTKMYPISDIKVYLGKHFRDDSMDDKAVQSHNIKKIIQHPNYHPSSLDSDLALIQLSQPVRFTSVVSPICLPDPRKIDFDKYLAKNYLGLVTGWGLEGNGLKASTVLKYAKLPIVDGQKCEDDYATHANHDLTVTGNMYCAGYSTGFIGTCSGDSGGPMVFSTGHRRNKKYFLMGVLSWGGVHGCAIPYQYSGFTRIFNFLKWINKYI